MYVRFGRRSRQLRVCPDIFEEFWVGSAAARLPSRECASLPFVLRLRSKLTPPTAVSPNDWMHRVKNVLHPWQGADVLKLLRYRTKLALVNSAEKREAQHTSSFNPRLLHTLKIHVSLSGVSSWNY